LEIAAQAVGRGQVLAFATTARRYRHDSQHREKRSRHQVLLKV
jgi:hypothetical protein